MGSEPSEKNIKLRSSGETLNSRSKKNIRCTVAYPCKRMTCIDGCVERRRAFFIHCGIFFGKQWDLDTHMTISWEWRKDNDNSWEIIISNMGKLSKFMSGLKVGKYIRVISVGTKGCPHVHLLVSKKTRDKIDKIVKKKWSNTSTTHSVSLFNIEGELGYFFDQNFLVSQLDLKRIKGTRLLSAARPMPCCFPTFHHEKNFRILFERYYETLPISPEDFKLLFKKKSSDHHE